MSNSQTPANTENTSVQSFQDGTNTSDAQAVQDGSKTPPDSKTQSRSDLGKNPTPAQINNGVSANSTELGNSGLGSQGRVVDDYLKDMTTEEARTLGLDSDSWTSKA
ncbi:uncharacterized protein PV09_08044 [Verruconis gallopava]|uniref:Uncharacterized protein n=1 Tax=Verruconis gallopava TaxID=253628 RepID=A0A0D1XDL8_9PEZI|nr:uncharacterized protein PV09_08044 [Verruconis gallopava]KIW00331.1 hypothetical protein PV09_08044 [Verruconis gallopava]